MTTIIGLTGNKRAGKSSFARAFRSYLVLEEGIDEEKVCVSAFASKIKRIAKDVFDLTHDQVHSAEMKEVTDARWSTTPRKIMQTIGESFRGISSDVWVDYLFRQIREGQAEVVLIEDVRYPNEAAKVRQAGDPGTVVGIKRPDIEIDDDHESETKLVKHWDDMVDGEILNNGDLDQLVDKAACLSRTFLDLDELRDRSR